MALRPLFPRLPPWKARPESLVFSKFINHVFMGWWFLFLSAETFYSDVELCMKPHEWPVAVRPECGELSNRYFCLSPPCWGYLSEHYARGSWPCGVCCPAGETDVMTERKNSGWRVRRPGIEFWPGSQWTRQHSGLQFIAIKWTGWKG